MNLNQLSVYQCSEKIMEREKIIANEGLNCYTCVEHSDTPLCENMLISPTCVNQYVMCDSSIVGESVKSVDLVDHLIQHEVNPNRIFKILVNLYY